MNRTRVAISALAAFVAYFIVGGIFYVIPRFRRFLAPVMVCLGLLGGCRTSHRNERPLQASLVTDSAAVSVYHRGGGYFADIGFTLTNDTGQPISRAGCGGPGWPNVEKRVEGRWVSAADQVYLTCRTIPDFSWEPGSQIKEVMRFLAYERGRNTYPVLLVDSIDGLYRLRWSFTEGRNVDAKGARRVDAVSNEFRMSLNSSPPPDAPGY